MPAPFLHGVDVVEVTDGVRPIRLAATSVIGVVGTAPDADAAAFPLNVPVLIAGSRIEAAKLDTVGSAIGTLPAALDGILDQIGAVVVVVRVAVGVDAAATRANVIGTVDVNGQRTGLQALLDAQSILHIKPRLIVCPGFSDTLAVATEMEAIATRLRAVAIVDGPSTTDAAALTYATDFGSARIYLVDPNVVEFDVPTAANVARPASARVAGLIAKTDNDEGFWVSPSNKNVSGIVGTSRAIDYTNGDPAARANLLNAGNVATIIHESGYRLWGNRTCSSDAKWYFLSVRRTADVINDSIMAAHLWAVDRNITRTYLSDVIDGVNGFLADLKARGAILGGRCWADPALNTPTQIAQGHVTFDFDFTPPYPAEQVTFRSTLTNNYLTEVFK